MIAQNGAMKPAPPLTPLLAALALGACAHARGADTANGETPAAAKAGQGAPAIDHAARAAIGRKDILAQMMYWAGEHEAHPEDAEATVGFAEALRKGGRSARAVEVAAEGLARFPDDRRLLRTLGLSLIASKRSGEALRPLTTLADADPQDWRVRSAIGVALDEQGRFEEARARYREALAIKPDEPGVLTNLGVSHLMTGEAPQAEAFLRQAAALAGAGAETRQNLALAVGLQGRFAEAEQLQRVDLPPALVANNMAYLRGLLTDARRWDDLGEKTPR